MHHKDGMIQVQLSLYSLDEDSNEKGETIEHRIHIERVQQVFRIFALGYKSCKGCRDIEIEASLGSQSVRSAKGRIA
jgi:hypothetical protein